MESSRYAEDVSLLCAWGWTEAFALERARELYAAGVWDFRRLVGAIDVILRSAGADGIIRWAR